MKGEVDGGVDETGLARGSWVVWQVMFTHQVLYADSLLFELPMFKILHHKMFFKNNKNVRQQQQKKKKIPN